MNKLVGIFGITANPPHMGHIQAIADALNSCDEVWVSPVFAHAFAKKFIDYNSRLNMLEMIFKEMIPELFNKRVFIKELDREIYEKTHQTPIYSYDVLIFAKNLFNNNSFKLIIGEDNYKPEIWSKFYKYQEIENKFGVIICQEKKVIHSTQIRDVLKEIKNTEQKEKNSTYLEKYLGKNLSKYVFENGFHEYVLI
jgi:nicotinate-nucleotide adenylyltransferase